ncbi:MAG: esterase-like activity of phytase family protein [Pseudobdellovibrio sp.]
MPVLRTLLVFSVFIYGVASSADLKLNVLKKWTLPPDYKINKKKVGGLSGCSIFENKIYFVSDDRGSEGGPRIFIFKFDYAKQEIDFDKPAVINVQTDKQSKILDLEGIAVLSNSNIFLSSEGDLNQKPRVNPDLFWINEKGERIKTVQSSDKFLPEKSGKQTKGVQNNLAFEGLAVDEEQKKWAVMLEAPLLQELTELKLVESSFESNKFDAVYSYPLPKLFTASQENDQKITAYFGVSDILFLNKTSYLILERGLKLSKEGLGYHTQFCEASRTDSQQLTRKCFYSMNEDVQLKDLIPSGANFEGLCWVNKQKKQFITVSDNNFSKSEKTVFILYQLN